MNVTTAEIAFKSNRNAANAASLAQLNMNDPPKRSYSLLPSICHNLTALLTALFSLSSVGRLDHLEEPHDINEEGFNFCLGTLCEDELRDGWKFLLLGPYKTNFLHSKVP